MSNSTLVHDAVQRAELRGPVPTLLCGDMQAEYGDLPCTHALIAGSWWGLGSEPTWFAHSALLGRRIDWLCANKAMQRLARAEPPDWTMALPTHAAQMCTIRLGTQDSIPLWVEAPALPHIMQRDPAVLWATVPPATLAAFRAAAHTLDGELAWRTLLACIEVCWRAAGHDIQPLSGRQGQAAPRKPAPPTAPNGDACGQCDSPLVL
jgi:hypothetical protein